MGVSREGFIVVARLQTGPTVQVERSPDQTPKIREGEADTPPQRGGSAENKATASTDQRQNTNAASAIDCHSRIGLHSHRHRCSSQVDN